MIPLGFFEKKKQHFLSSAIYGVWFTNEIINLKNNVAGIF